MNMKKIYIASIVALTFFLSLTKPLHTCVGRLLVVAVTNSSDQVIMGQMLSLLINERTGTTVDVIELDDVDKCHEAVLKGKANIYLSYIGLGRIVMQDSPQVNDPQRVYTLVSQGYLEKFDMVWLRPFGFEGPLGAAKSGKAQAVSLAAPVTTKDVLRKFPVLDRVINKLAGRIDDSVIAELAKKTADDNVKDVVKDFLKEEKLI